jgi:hypothetical protein
MDVHHEFVEMDSPSRYTGRNSCGEEVGETRLAGTNISIYVEAASGILGIFKRFLESRKTVDERCLAGNGKQSTPLK